MALYVQPIQDNYPLWRCYDLSFATDTAVDHHVLMYFPFSRLVSELMDQMFECSSSVVSFRSDRDSQHSKGHFRCS